MRLGLLGPSGGQYEALERAARFLRREQSATRVLYLGVDGALDRIVRTWSEQLVGEAGPEAAGETALCRRATARCLTASAEEIIEYVAREEERSRLRMFTSLPGDEARTVELLASKVAVAVYDKAYLDEEDILPATWLVFGKSRDVLIKRIGRRWFVSPGSFPAAGVMLIDDEGEEGAIRVSAYSGALEELRSERLECAREVNLRVSGGG